MSCKFPFLSDCVVRMCTVPPPPPLPEEPIVSDPNSKGRPTKVIDINNPSFSYNDICQWAADFPQLWEACAKYNICLDRTPFMYHYKQLDPILQIGPTCGLVALSMLLKGEVSPDEMMVIAKKESYSNNGEMFSCKDMVKLIEKVVSLAELENVRYYLQKGGLFSHSTVEKLVNGSTLLVPYDADFNHGPCLKQGHKAHWALICGVVLVDNPGASYDSDPDNVFVLCRHGKSRYLAVWSLADLERSNKNLYEFSPKREEDGLTYVLPPGGIAGDHGLRDQFIIFDGV